MTDREMLELAAKAGGINGLDFDYAEKEGFGYFGPRLPAMSGICAQIHRYWDPLRDDGDALRLAVKLHMQVSVTTESCRAETLPCLGVRVNDSDENLATRRAVVMAAAAVGREMK